MNKFQEDIIDYCDIHETKMLDDFKDHVAWGLSQPQKILSCKYIYDEKGSNLFQEICSLPEYYLTDCEREILESNDQFFYDLFSKNKLHIIELGSGDGAKTKVLLQHLYNQDIEIHYVPIDISCSSIELLTHSCKEYFPGMKIHGLIADYFKGLSYLTEKLDGKKIVLFLGSNIGNMDVNQSTSFLLHISKELAPDDYLFIGFDLQKDTSILISAYDDPKGITEQFHKNLLHRINRELDGRFDSDEFAYRCFYDPTINAIQSYLVSNKKQTIEIGAINTSIHFRKGETIHTESSYKYSTSQIESLALSSGFQPVHHLFDRRSYFVDSLWQVKNKQ